MIVTMLKGGLGNQMFQYAVGRSLSIKHCTELKLDISFFENQVDKTVDFRQFTLNDFRVNASVASKDEICKLTRRTKIQLLDRILNKIIGRKSSFIYHDRPNYIEALNRLPNNSYLEGFFQSYKYFQGISEVLKQEFIPKNTSLIPNFDGIQNNSVSIHIRRGDYVGNDTHPICDLNYYTEAISYINGQLTGDIHYFIFSDDEQWIQNEFLKDFHLKSYTVIKGDQEHPVNDLYLMSICQHNIIANSTYSWWGAWLNNNQNKIVTAPKKWSNNPFWTNDDLIPAEWIML